MPDEPPFNSGTLVFDFTVSEVRLRLPNGQEIPAPPGIVLGPAGTIIWPADE